MDQAIVRHEVVVIGGLPQPMEMHRNAMRLLAEEGVSARPTTEIGNSGTGDG